MSNDEIKALEAEELELMRQLEDARKKKQEAIMEHNRRLAEEKRTAPVEISVVSFNGAMIETESVYRDDLVALYRTIPGRGYRGDRRNLIPVGEWNRFTEGALQLKNITIAYKNGVQEKIHKHLNAPSWEISKSQYWLRAEPGPNANRWILGSIPGSSWNTQSEFYSIPFAEAWRLLDTLKDVEGVVWEEDAKELAIEQLEKRARIDQIPKMKVSERFADFDMNGCKLMPFQTVGVEFLDCIGGRGIIGDEMGLGKTWQALAYALYKKQEQESFRTVIVCPASLIPNWNREIKKLTGETARVLIGATPTDIDFVNMLTSPKAFTIINYEIVRRKAEDKKDSGRIEQRFLWAELINLAKPDYIIVDEGHYIKDIDSLQSRAVRSLQAPHVVFLTGTPVLNRPGELFPMLNVVAPETFPANDTFLKQYTYDGKVVRNPEELRSILRTIMIRRLKKDVLADLPKLQRIVEYDELSVKAQKLYQRVLEGIYLQLEAWDASGKPSQKQVTNILTQIMRLKQVCAYDAVERTAELATELYDQSDETSHRKIIIFSQFKATAYSIYQRLADQGALCFVDITPTEFKTVDGEERDKRVQQFQTDPNIKYLVVTEKTTKEGHNITAAGHVIFNDLFWTPAGHDQAIGRAYARLNDLHGVDAYFVISQLPEGDSIADWNWQLLNFKQGVINVTVEGLHDEAQDMSIQMAIIEKLKEAMWTKKKRR